MASITVSNLTKSYGAIQVLFGIDLEIRDKEFVVLVGPSGCGKSTLLRMIAGLEEITGGELLIDDAMMNHVSPQNRDLAMVFQSYALYPHLTVAENLGFSLSLKREKKSVIEKQVAEAAKILHLEDYLDRMPRHLSGGQRQRVAMGRAIVRHPGAFLFDEPLSNLDAKLRTHMRTEIRQLHQTLGATSVYVTHDQIEAMTLADRIVVMNAGRIDQIGTPIEVFDRPQTQFVASFIGAPTMNFLDGEIVKGKSDAPVLRVSGTDVTIPLDPRFGNYAGRAASVGIRPQHVSLNELTEPGGRSGDVGAEIRLVEQTGCETNLLLDVLGCEFTVQTKERLDAKTNTSVSLGLPTEKLHLFDKLSGARLE